MGFWSKNKEKSKGGLVKDYISPLEVKRNYETIMCGINTRDKIELLNKIVVENPKASDLHRHAQKKLIELIDKL